MMARASGAYCSLPVPNASAIGTIPMMVASEVMRIGRRRTRQDVHDSILDGASLLFQPVREFDDQNAVGSRDADKHEHSHQAT